MNTALSLLKTVKGEVRRQDGGVPSQCAAKMVPSQSAAKMVAFGNVDEICKVEKQAREY